MGCCEGKATLPPDEKATNTPEAQANVQQAGTAKEEEKKKEPITAPKLIQAEAKNAPATLILHINSDSTPRFIQVFHVLDGGAKIDQRVTPDLSTIHAVIKRYPTAEINGKVLSGEKVIARYLAQQRGLYPIGPVAIYECESLVEQLEDMWKVLARADNKSVFQSVYQSAQLLQAVEKRLKPGQKYYGGDKPNYADVVVFCFLTTFFLSDSVKEEREGAVPQRLKGLVEHLKAQPLFKPAAKV
jgi:hypothetical protein